MTMLEILGIHLIGCFISWLFSCIADDDECKLLSAPFLPFWPIVIAHCLISFMIYLWAWITDTSIHIHCPEDYPL
jgi:hypothetical protein